MTSGDSIKHIKIGMTRCFLVRCDGGYLMIDTNLPNTYERSRKKIDKMNFMMLFGAQHRPIYAEDYDEVLKSWRKLIEHGAVDYDFHQEREALLASDMPGRATQAKFFE